MKIYISNNRYNVSIYAIETNIYTVATTDNDMNWFGMIENDDSLDKIYKSKLYDYEIDLSQGEESRVYDVVINENIMGNEGFVPVRIKLICDNLTSISLKSIILDEEKLMIVINNKIFGLSFDNMQYDVLELQYPFGRYFDLYACNDSYVLYGDHEVRRLDSSFNTMWKYTSTETLINQQRKPAIIENDTISITDWNGNSHILDMNGNLCQMNRIEPSVIRVDIRDITSPFEFLAKIKEKLNIGLANFTWNSFWNLITSKAIMPDMLVIDGWTKFKSRCFEEASIFEGIMNTYNMLKSYKYCNYLFID